MNLSLHNYIRYLHNTSFALIIFILFSCSGEKEPVQQGPLPFPVVGVTIMDVPIKKEFVGQVYGYFDIPIRARVTGFLEGMHFSEGYPVKKGQLLYTIDAQPFEASVAKSQSQLAEAKIQAIRANNEFGRIEPLAKIKAVSQSDLDAALAERDAAEAAVEAAKANLSLSKIELSYTRILSPINGLIGKSQVDVGEFVGQFPNPVILNTVSRIDSIHVEFFITESDYLRFAKEFIVEGQIRKDREPRPMELIFGDGSVYNHIGKINFFDREVDPETGALLVQATFPNPNKLIRPGQFAKIRALVETVENGMLIPQRTVKELQGNYFVMLVDEDGLVKQHAIQMGEKYQDYWIVQTGLDQNSKILFEGLQKVREGMTIQPIDTVFKSNYAE